MFNIIQRRKRFGESSVQISGKHKQSIPVNMLVCCGLGSFSKIKNFLFLISSVTEMKRSLCIIFLIALWCPVHHSQFSSSAHELSNEEVLKNKESHNLVSNSNTQAKYCRKPATCEKLKNSTCYGVRLPYTSTSITHISDVESQDDVQVGYSITLLQITNE